MAGAAREITDPVEAAKHGIGSSRRLIAATLDDLSDHHSWLETYHRDERLRAERLRRRELRERLERRYQVAAATATHAARSSYVTSRGVARISKRNLHVFARWAAPRLRTLAKHTADTAITLWRWCRRYTPVFTRRAYGAIRDGFAWSVEASEQAGHGFRAHASKRAAKASDDLLRQSAPVRRRARCAWARTQLQAKRARDLAERRAADWMATSQMLAALRKIARRGLVIALRFGTPLTRRAQAAGVRMEDAVSARILRLAPAFRQLLRNHMPGAPMHAVARTQSGRALILRPTTALVCVAPTKHRLPVPYRM